MHSLRSMAPRIPASAHLVLCWLLFFLWRPFELNIDLCRMVLAVITLTDLVCIFRRDGSLPLPKHTGEAAALTGVGVWSFFAAFGKDVFNIAGEFLLISFDRILLTLLAGVLLMPVLSAVLDAFGHICSRPGKAPSDSRRARLLTALLFIGVLLAEQLLLWLAFFPGGIPGDAVNTIAQAMGAVPLGDDHPFLNSLIMRGLLKLWPNVAVLSMFQMISAALVTAAVLYELYRMGLNRWLLLICGMGFLLLPNNLMNNVTVLKDTPFTIAFAGMALQLFHYAVGKKDECGPMWLASLSLCVFSVMALRPNGFIAGAACCGLLLVLFIFHAVREKKAAPKRLLAAAIIPLMMFAVWQGPVKKALKVQSGDPKTGIFVTDALGAVAHQGLPLSEKTMAIMERVQPMADWAEKYDPWLGPDAYFVNSHFNISAITLPEALGMYLEVLTRYPAVVLKDRLNGSDVVWDILEPEQVEYCRHFYYDLEILPEALTGSLPQSALTEFAWQVNVWYMKNMYLTLDTEPVASALLWRSGPYIILLLLLCVFWWRQKLYPLLIPAVPLLVHTLSLLASVYHQSFRYTWAVQVIAVMLVPLTMAAMRLKERSVKTSD